MTDAHDQQPRAASRMKAASFVALLVAAAGALVAHMRVFNFVTDDAFISFVYSRNLVQHGQLVFNLGERVEGYTNFLWTIFLAGLLKLGWQPESSSVVFGVAFAMGTMCVCAWLTRRLRGDDTAWSPWDALPALLLATIPGYACWSSGGLETQMFTFFVTLGAALYVTTEDHRRPAPWAAVAFALAALTRPEGYLFFALTITHRGLAMLLEKRPLPSLRQLSLLALFGALVAPHLLWRRWYYGWWLPNTFYIKASGGAGTWQRGLYYLRRLNEQHLLWVLATVAVIGLAVALYRRKLEPRTAKYLGYAGLVTLVFAAYVASVGGDFMGLFRFALPPVPLLVVAATLGLRALVTDTHRVAGVAVGAALVGLFAWHAVPVDRAALVIGADNGIDSPGFLRTYTADRAAVGKWFGRHAQPDDYAVVGGAGAQVWYSGMASLDAFGLSDEYIAHKVPANNNRPGHQKYAPLEYELKRRPTIITSRYYRMDPSPDPTLNPQDVADWRARGYHFVTVLVPGLSGRSICHPSMSCPYYTFLKRLDRTVGPFGPLNINGDID